MKTKYKPHTNEEKLAEFERLLDIMKRLRAECPWDREQTFESIRSNTIEETYELSDAILSKNMDLIKKELGDLLLHIVFYSEMGSETNDFDIYDVCKTINEKLIFRHPHVFGSEDVNGDTTKVLENWEALKLKEKDGNKTVLGGVPTSLPTLIKAFRIQEKAASVGFDWEYREQVWDKSKEEIAEFQAEVDMMDADRMESEFGDVLFSMVNAARLYDINPDTALERTNKKFIRRFNFLEAETISKGKDLKKMTLAEMDEIWEEAKKSEL
ncbi:MAG: nucleoside triphosphate pyrophosphohydrolase [Porphyromonadaceae bacterium]|nr:nucleoside triphosphate pyrophosphohydrolase [Porphyromonadaceae bacterium]